MATATQATYLTPESITTLAYKRIVVPLDGSALAEAVLPYIESLARTLGSEITIVCAHPRLESTFTGEMALIGAGLGASAQQIFEADGELDRENISYLDGMQRKLAARGFTVHTAKPRMPPAEAIVDIARRRHADLIAMTTHGRSGLGRVLLGSVADEVLQRAPCPVLLVHPRPA